MLNRPRGWRRAQTDRGLAWPAENLPRVPARVRPLCLRLIHAGEGSLPLNAPVGVLGHALSRPRRRYIQLAECVLATIAGNPVGLAAYHRLESDVRLVLEFLLDPDLSRPVRDEVCGALIASLEMLVHDDCVRCLMVTLDADVPLEPFRHRGYGTVVVDHSGAWLQKLWVSRPISHLARVH
jgi:hypothetical protein